MENERIGKSKAVAGLLCFFLGVLGVHRFYMGYVVSGILMLVLNVAGALLKTFAIGRALTVVAGIWVLADFVRILFGKMRDAKGRELR